MKLYILISSGGDGSYYPNYTFDADLIKLMEKADEWECLDCECDPGVDADGFHYDEINVPDDSTPESLGISASRFLDESFELKIKNFVA